MRKKKLIYRSVIKEIAQNNFLLWKLKQKGTVRLSEVLIITIYSQKTQC